MTEPHAKIETADSSAYRRPGLGERIAARMAGLIPEGAPRRLLRAVYRATLGRRVVVSRLPGGEVVRLHSEYRFVSWNPAEYAAFREAVRPGTVALDVGANVGAYSILLGQWVGAAGRVFAFEPAPETFAGLSRQLVLNGLSLVVTPIAAAVSAQSGRATLAGGGTSGANRLDAAAEGLTVDTVSIDDFCARQGITPAFIKIDVEGAELLALRGARETIRAAGDGLALFVEMHPTLWREMGISVAEVRAEVAGLGLRAEPLRPVEDPWALEGECLRLVRA